MQIKYILWYKLGQFEFQGHFLCTQKYNTTFQKDSYYSSNLKTYMSGNLSYFEAFSLWYSWVHYMVTV
jgi:hypothetical protein